MQDPVSSLKIEAFACSVDVVNGAYSRFSEQPRNRVSRKGAKNKFCALHWAYVFLCVFAPLRETLLPGCSLNREYAPFTTSTEHANASIFKLDTGSCNQILHCPRHEDLAGSCLTRDARANLRGHSVWESSE